MKTLNVKPIFGSKYVEGYIHMYSLTKPFFVEVDSIGKHEVYKLRSNHRAHRLKREVVSRVQKSVFVKKRGRQTRQSSKDKNLNEDKSIFNFFSPQLRAKIGRSSFTPPVLLHSAASGQPALCWHGIFFSSISHQNQATQNQPNKPKFIPRSIIKV